MLEALARHPGAVLTHTQIIDAAWGEGQATPECLRTVVCGLRRKLEPDPKRPAHLLAEHGIGYRLERRVSADSHHP